MQSRSRVPERAPKHEHEHRPAAHGGAVTLSMHPVSLRWRRRVRDLLVAAAAFVALYSLLPHKEMRFLFPVLPLFNTCAAAAIARLHLNRVKSLPWRAAYAACVAALLASAAASAVFMQASRCVPCAAPVP